MKPAEQRHLPRQVDAFKLAQQGVVLEGSLAVSELPRLAATICSSATVLHPVMSFTIDDQGHRTVKSDLRASLSIVCQRCLEPMSHDVASEFHGAFVTTDEQAKALPAHLEPVMLSSDSGYADLYDMLEDELLLSLPISALHDQCEASGLPKSFGEIELDKGNAVEKPFAALVELLKKGQ